MKKEEKKKSELELLWEARDIATTDVGRQRAQNKIDEYFLGEPKKRKGKKEKKKRIFSTEDDYYDSDFLEF